MPSLTGLSHISFAVRDRDASVRWYVDVLGFQVVVADMDEDRWKRSICMDPSGVVVGFTQHHEPAPFDHHNAGVDHIAFAVKDRPTLEEWQQRFAELGVRHSPIAETDLGSVLSFRDPDDIQLELFHLAV